MNIVNLYKTNESFGILVKAIFKTSIVIIAFLVAIQICKILKNRCKNCPSLAEIGYSY